MPAFELQFPLERVQEYAARYAYEDDGEVIAIGQRARERGYYTRDEFLAVCRWKTARTGPLVAKNSAEDIETATLVPLSDGSTESRRIKALRSLHGAALTRLARWLVYLGRIAAHVASDHRQGVGRQNLFLAAVLGMQMGIERGRRPGGCYGLRSPRGKTPLPERVLR